MEINTPPRTDWERQKFESVMAYKAFQTFLEMQKRNVETVALELSKNRDTVIKWSEKYEWERRAAMFDFFQSKAKEKYSKQEQKKMAAQQIGLGKMLQAKGIMALKNRDLSEEPVVVILKAIELGIQIERSARNIDKKSI